MATHASAKKRTRQTIVKTEQNRAHRSRTKTLLKNIHAAIESNDKKTAQGLFVAAQSNIAKMSKLGIFKKNKSARQTSRLAAAIQKLA